MRLILASGSPRRRELIERITKKYEVIVPNVDESVPEGTPPAKAAMMIAARKAMAVAADHPGVNVIGCDTIVVLDGKILGKPEDMRHAFRMLRALSRRSHEVITGCAIVRKDGILRTFYEKTIVHFGYIPGPFIREYVASGEPMDKAGAYAIQGAAGLFVTGIEGDYNNVVGMPVGRIYRELLRL